MKVRMNQMNDIDYFFKCKNRTIIKRRLVVAVALLVIVLFICFRENGNPRLDYYLRILEAHKTEIQNKGDVLEVLVREQIARHIPNREQVMGNLVYYSGTKIVGELDVVIFTGIRKNFLPIAVVVEEIKLWKNHKKALSKAKKQLKRFVTYLEAGKITKFKMKGKEINLSESNFPSRVVLHTWGPKGSTKSGFDHEFNLTPKEGEYLYEKIRK